MSDPPEHNRPVPRVDDRIRRRRREVTREAGRRRLRIVLGSLAVVVVLLGAVLALHSPLFGAKAVTVTGNAKTPSAAIIDAAGLERRPPLIDLDVAAAERSIEALPWVARAVVSLRWPDGVSVVVTERRPVAAWSVPHGGVLLLDATGRVLAEETTAPAGVVTVALTGPAPPPGASVGESGQAVVAVAAAVPRSILPDVVGLAASSSGVVAHLRDGATAEFGQPSVLREKMVALATLLETPSVAITAGDTIDLRVPTSPIVTPSMLKRS